MSSLLFTAVENNDLSLVKSLLNQGISPNFNQDHPQNWMPLHEACRLNNIEIARELICYKANVNAIIKVGVYNVNWTPLNFAISNNNFQLVQLLTRAGGILGTSSAPTDFA
jgi:ankyrin repeat protein